MEIGTGISLGLYFVIMIAIGLYGFRESTDDTSGYLLGGRKMGPAVTSLSAGASDMSGWMLLGLPGAMYMSGLSAAWIALGLLLGALANYLLVAPKLRVYTEVAQDAITIPDFFSKRFEDNSHLLRIVASIVIVIFFTLYTSSGVVAGGKLFESAFGLSYYWGLYVTAGVVVLYTLLGGFMAVSITDFVQGCIMFVALVLVPVVAINAVGGFDATHAEVLASPAASVPDAPSRENFFNWFQGLSVIGIISAASWGLGYFGQPHIIVRFMAIRSLKDIATARYIGMGWMTVTVIGAVAVGVTGVAYVNEHSLNSELTDPETIFILFSQVLFHPLVTGFLLAAILAAIMSTISSQLLVSSSSLTEDFYKTFLRKNASQKELVMVGRLSVLAVSLVAIALAFDRSSSILSLVSYAWAGFGAAFGPIILLSLFWKGLTRNGALAGMITGAATVLVWLYAPITVGGQPLSGTIYAIVPGFALSLVAAVLASLIKGEADPRVQVEFDAMTEAMSAEKQPLL